MFWAGSTGARELRHDGSRSNAARFWNFGATWMQRLRQVAVQSSFRAFAPGSEDQYPTNSRKIVSTSDAGTRSDSATDRHSAESTASAPSLVPISPRARLVGRWVVPDGSGAMVSPLRC